MATLVSPGVSVTVTDESAYASAGTGTVPLIMIATATNKLQPGSSVAYAPGTLSANANKLYLVTSQRDLLQTFGTPTFYSVAGTPQYDNQLNELGLFTAYQYLGIATTAYVVRADVDLSQLIPTDTMPVGPAVAGQYWFDTAHTTWGIFQSNGNVNSALAWASYTPTVFTSNDNLNTLVQSRYVTSTASSALITVNANLVINNIPVALTVGQSLSDVASSINNSVLLASIGIYAEIYARTGKPDHSVAAIADMYYLRIIAKDSTMTITLAGSNNTILSSLGFVDQSYTPNPDPTNYAVPVDTYGNDGDYVVDAYSSVQNIMSNNIWQKISLETLDGNSTSHWFHVGSTDAVYPGWGWAEAIPTIVTGTVANPSFTPGAQCTIKIGSGPTLSITCSGSNLASFISNINTQLCNTPYTNAIAISKTVGGSNYLQIINYDSTSIQFNDVVTQSAVPTCWANAGISPTQTYYGSVTGTTANPSFVAAIRDVSSATVVNPGTVGGYAVGDILTVSGSPANATLTVASIQVLASGVSVSAGGANYAVDDILYFADGGVNYVQPVQVRVTSIGGGGSITGLTLTVPGQYRSATPANPVSPASTSGVGTGATVNFSWGVSTVTVSNPGQFYTDPTNPVSVSGGSGSAAGATFNLTMGFYSSNTFTIDPGTNGVGVQTIHVPAAPNNTLTGVVAAINAAFPNGPIVASVVSGNYLSITNQNGTQFTVEDVSGTPLGGAGIAVGVTYGRKLVYQGFYPSLTVPSGLDQLAPTNVWINTTIQDRGANLVIKRYDSVNWVPQNTSPNTGYIPMYSSDAVANAAFGGAKAIGSIYARYNATAIPNIPPIAAITFYRWDGSYWVATNWQTGFAMGYTASKSAPAGEPTDGTYWYDTVLRADIMVGNGQIWQGYRQRYPATDVNGPIISGTQPLAQSTGNSLVDNDIWIDSSMVPYPVIYRYNASNATWILIDNTDHSSPGGIIFEDARWNVNGYTDGSQDISKMVLSSYVDPDAPNAELYPSGMLLFNTRYSTYNVKQYMINYFPTLSAPYDSNAWVTASGNRPDGTPYMGSDAQRAIVVKALNASLVSNQEIRAEAVNYNLIATPGYIECLSEMVLLNTDRKETAFIVADPPGSLPADGTSLQAWATNSNDAAYDGPDGLITHNPYAGLYYPWALATNLDGSFVFVPPSEMALRTIAYNDQVAYPWFAPAGFNRGLVTGVNSVGYLKADGTYQPVTLNQGQRDVLYINNINPIAFIPQRGLVVYGQKTLNPIATALDRINVARLINYMKYQLNNLAQPFLFEPNDKQTRQSVTNTFNSFMGNLVGLRALYDFVVVCDETNNTPARIDANELWIDIAIKPEKAIEFIYIPIRILNTGDPMPGGNRTSANA
jgi:Phage tail sheath C-terminal domain